MRILKRSAGQPLLIEGHTVVQEWSAFEVPKFPHVEVVPGTHCYVQAGQYLRLRKITGDVVLGRVQQLVTLATIASVQGDLVWIGSVQGEHDVPHHGRSPS